MGVSQLQFRININILKTDVSQCSTDLDRSVDEDTVADKIVVVEVSADDRRSKVDDNAENVHH